MVEGSLDRSEGFERELEPDGNVGIENIPHQYLNSALSKGFVFNLMCVGETGIGKTSFLETLFNRKLRNDDIDDNDELDQNSKISSYQVDSFHESVSLSHHSYVLVEGSVKLKLNVIESLGYGDQVDKTNSSHVIVQYLSEQHEKYIREEMNPKRRLDKFEDTRVHLCFYFISPTSPLLKLFDLYTLKELGKCVNVIPIISKADSLTKEEVTEFKANIQEQFKIHDINIYKFPLNDPATKEINTMMNENMPFTVISSNCVEKQKEKILRLRKYPWGSINVDDPNNSNFPDLRKIIFKANLNNLISSTRTELYERLRTTYLEKNNINPALIKLDASFSDKGNGYNTKEGLITKIENEMGRKLELLEESYKSKMDTMNTEYKKKIKSLEANKIELQATIESILAEGTSKRTKKK